MHIRSNGAEQIDFGAYPILKDSILELRVALFPLYGSGAGLAKAVNPNDETLFE